MGLEKSMEKSSGFTIIEILVSLSLFILIIMLTGSMFTLSQRSFISGADESELSQNTRVVMDRVSREIRQSQEIVTALATSSEDAVSEIFFRDGHNISTITYIRYFASGTDLMRTHEAYYFASDPAVYVIWNAVDSFGNTTTRITLDSNESIIGEYFKSIRFWGSKSLVYLSVALEKGLKTLNVTTSIAGRNF